MLSEGEQSLFTSLELSRADRYWDDNRSLQQDDCTSNDRALGLRYEYGWSYYHTLFAATSFEMDRCGTEKATGIPDLKLGMRGRVNPFRNGHTWELALILPVNGDRLDRRSPGNGLFGIEAGLYRSYRDDPYQRTTTSDRQAVWGWGAGINLWSEAAGEELWGELSWRKPFSGPWRFRVRLVGRYSLGGGDAGSGGIFDRRKTIDYDRLGVGARISRQLNRGSSLGLGLEQAVWGRNTASDTILKLDFHRSWD